MSARRGCRDVCPASRVQEVQNSGPAASRTPTPRPREVCLTSAAVPNFPLLRPRVMLSSSLSLSFHILSPNLVTSASGTCH